MTFPGFSSAALQFLRGLGRNNRRPWFQRRKHIYEQELKLPLIELVTAINAELGEFAPEYVTAPQKSIFRIYRDTRFNPDKRPYKTHVAAVFPKQRIAKHSGACFYFHFSAEELLVWAGVYMATPQELLAIRTLLAEKHEEFRAILRDRKLRRIMQPYGGEKVMRMPSGFAKNHPAADLLRMKQWGLEVSLDPKIVTTPKLVPEIANRFRAAVPFVEFLNRPFARAARAVAWY